VEKYKGVSYVTISAICFGFLPIFARLSYEEGLTPSLLLFYRFTLASLFFSFILLLTKKLSLPFKKLPYLFLLGSVFYFSQSYFYLTSILYIPISVAILILDTYPVFVALFSSLLKIEKLKKEIFLSLPLSMIGLLFITSPIFIISYIGIILALLSSLTYTFYIIISSRVIRGINEEIASFYIIVSAAFSFYLFNFFLKELYLPLSSNAWYLIIGVSIISTGIAITAFLQGLKIIGPALTSLISLLELIVTLILSFLIFNETLSFLQWIGAALIIISIVISLR